MGSLADVVGDDGLELVPVPGDGNCQFHAVSHQLTSRFPDVCPSGVYTDEFVRSLAVTGVENMSKDLQEAFCGDFKGDHRNGLHEEASFKACLAKLREDGTWGNHSSLLGIVNELSQSVFGKPVEIIVYNTSGPPIQVTSWNESRVPPDEDGTVTLCLAFEGEVHYHSTRPAETQGASRKKRTKDDEPGVVGGGADGADGADGGGPRASKRPATTLSPSGDTRMANTGDGGPSKDTNNTKNNNNKQQQEKKKKNAPEKGLLYRRVPAGDVVPGQSAGGGASAEGFFDVCFSIFRNEMRETYTRRRGGDGFWRMWPLVEGIAGHVEGSPPWMSEGHKRRYGRADDSRRPMTVCVRENDERDVPHTQAIVCVTLNVQRVEGGGGAVRMLRSVQLDVPAFKRENKESAGGLRGIKVDEAIKSIGKEICDAASKSPPKELITAHENLAAALAKRDKELKRDDRAKGSKYAKAVLGDYDRRMLVLDKECGETDEEQDDMDAADKERFTDMQRVEEQSTPMQIDGEDQGDRGGWASTWRHAVHEGGRRWMVECLGDTSKGLARRLVDLVADDEDRRARVLGGMDCPEDIRSRITTRHLKGEALELLTCYLATVWGECDMQDYINGSIDCPRFVKTKVVKVLMSGAPTGSPFRLEDGYLTRLLGGGEKKDHRELARKLESHCRSDRAFDVIVVLEEVGGRGADHPADDPADDPANARPPTYHFQVIQCKARKNLNAAVDINKYVAYWASLFPLAKRTGSLVRLDWVSTCYNVKSVEYEGDFADLKDDGQIGLMLFQDFLREKASVKAAVELAKDGFDVAGVVPREIEPLQLRDFQKEALDKLAEERKNGTRRGTIVAATGAGKTILMTLDALTSQRDGGHKLPLCAMAPAIHLAYQLATTFALVERQQVAMDENDTHERHHYVVTSDNERTSTPLLRSIKNDQVLGVMLRHHHAGNLGYCRFFTTVQGAGRFWNKVIDFIRVTRGVDARLDDDSDPVFETCIRDEVHMMSGASDAAWTLGLNIYARWTTSFTATPEVEISSKARIRAALAEEDRRRREEQTGDEERDDEVDGDEERENEEDQQDQQEEQEEEEEEVDDGAEFTARMPGDNDAGHEYASEFGLSGIQVLSQSLQFESIERILERDDADADLKALAKLVQEVERLTPTTNEDGSLDLKNLLTGIRDRDPEKRDVARSNLKKLLTGIRDQDPQNRDVVLFDVRPEKHKGECVCGRAPGSGHHDLGHHDWCPASFELGQGTSTGLRSADGIFRAYVDNDGKLEWMISSNLAKGARVEASAIVLGQYVGVDNKVTLSLRRGQDVRGLVVHDSTDCQRGRNLIGRALHTYTFGEAFAAEPRILARPAVATYVIDPLAIPLAATHLSLKDVNACLGYEVEREWDADAQRMVPTGVKVKSASKIFFEVLFNDLQESGKAPRKVVVTMKEYAAMILVIRLLEQGQVLKPIVFCPSAASCRRSMALLRLLLRRHQRSQPLLANVGSGHVFQSATNYVLDADGNQQGEQEAMPLHVRHHLLGEFQSSESYVLFNTNLLSTGVDLPCCDGVVLVSPSTKRRTVLQRWGRSLRVEAHREDKEGTLALVAEDPLEPTELVEARAQALGIEDLEVLKDDNQLLDAEKFRAVLRTAEAAAASSYKVLGDVFDIVAQFRRQASSRRPSAGTKMVVFSSNGPETGDTFHLDAGMERAFRMLFQARTRTLMLPNALERFEAYRDGGVRDWVRKTLRGMTNNSSVSRLTGIGTRDTYTPEDGSGELNMGGDINNWKKDARKENESDNRTQKQEWLTTIRDRLIAELNSVIADEAQDAGFKTRCRALLARIPDPYWETKKNQAS